MDEDYSLFHDECYGPSSLSQDGMDRICAHESYAYRGARERANSPLGTDSGNRQIPAGGYEPSGETVHNAFFDRGFKP
jgi:hypothetical protein